MVTKDFESFTRGTLIWANHNNSPFYGLPPRCLTGSFYPNKIPQKCATNLVNTRWCCFDKGTSIKYKFIKYYAGNCDGTYSDTEVIKYCKDERTQIKWEDTDNANFVKMVANEEMFWLEGSGENV